MHLAPFSRWPFLNLLLSSANQPRLIRSIVGRPRHQGVMVGMGQKDSYVGLVVLTR
jgi:hypothetical protein